MASKTPEKANDIHEEELNAILTTEEQVDLTLLIANITEVMQTQLTDTFDASMPARAKPTLERDIKGKNPNVDDGTIGETAEEEKARKLQEQREKDLSEPKMTELKKDALEFFQEWRESVIARIGSVVNSSKVKVEEQKKKGSIKATPEASQDTKIIGK